jgi:hopanoid biosynthesis associated protein HpnK
MPVPGTRAARGPQTNRLIVTADDFGLAPEVNEAVEQAHRSGILTAASLMVAGPAAADAIRRARAMPQLRVGLHLVLVEGQAVLEPEQVRTLSGGDGHLRTDMLRLAVDLAMKGAVRRELSREIKAQFDSYQRTGLALDHVNAHKHFHLHPVVLETIAAVGRQYAMRAVRMPVEPRGQGLPPSRFALPQHALRQWAAIMRVRARSMGLVVPDAVYGLGWSGGMTESRILSLFRSLPEGIVEIYTHPATRDDFGGHAADYDYTGELAALCHPEVRSAVQRSGRFTGGYSDCLH